MQDVCIPALPQLTDKWNKYQFHLAQVVGGMRAELNNDRFDIVVLGFRPGSVVVDFLSLLPKEEPVDVDFIQTSLSKILRNTFGNQTAVTVQCK